MQSLYSRNWNQIYTDAFSEKHSSTNSHTQVHQQCENGMIMLEKVITHVWIVVFVYALNTVRLRSSGKEYAACAALISRRLVYQLVLLALRKENSKCTIPTCSNENVNDFTCTMCVQSRVFFSFSDIFLFVVLLVKKQTPKCVC